MKSLLALPVTGTGHTIGLVVMYVYFVVLGVLCLYGFHRYLMVYLYYRHAKRDPKVEKYFENLPPVTVQLPIFNEMYVAERLIDASCLIQYPREKLQIQVLDDSTDETVEVARKKVEECVSRGLEFLVREQRRQGYWEVGSGNYRIAMTALSGIAFASEGSTSTRGKYARNISRAVDYLLDASQPNGLIGFPDDYHYMYGHGFSMLFLSQVLGEEEDEMRRKELVEVLTKSVRFCGESQTQAGG